MNYHPRVGSSSCPNSSGTIFADDRRRNCHKTLLFGRLLIIIIIEDFLTLELRNGENNVQTFHYDSCERPAHSHDIRFSPSGVSTIQPHDIPLEDRSLHSDLGRVRPIYVIRFRDGCRVFVPGKRACRRNRRHQ